MKVECLQGVVEEGGIFTAFHMFRNDHPQCKGCVVNFQGRCNTNTVIAHAEEEPVSHDRK